jgi:hypothetical protein
MAHFHRLLPALAAAFSLVLVAAETNAADSGCRSSLTTICPTKATPWKLFKSPQTAISDVRLVLQDRASSPVRDTESSVAEDARVQGEEMAGVMTANGLATRYAGNVQRRQDAAGLPGASGGSHLLILVPTGGHGNDGSVDYVALLYDVADLAQPSFQSSVRLGKNLPWRARDISATDLVNAFADAGLLDSAHHVIVPVKLF